MAEENNVSRASVTVGTFQEDDHCPKIHVCADVSKELAQECQETLKGYGLDDDFTEFSGVVVWHCVEGKEEGLQKCLDNLFSGKDFKGTLAQDIRKDVCRESQPSLTYQSRTAQGKVITSFRLPPEVANREKMNMIPNIGSLAETTTKVEFTGMLGNDFSEISDLFKNGGYSFMHAFAQKFSWVAEVSLSPELPENVKKVLAPLLGMREQEADMICNLAKVYQKLDLNFQFNSTEQLPEKVKKIVWSESNMIEMVKKGPPSKTEMEQEVLDVVLGSVNSLELLGVAPDLARVHATLRGPGFAEWQKN